ncbi:FAD-binding oxidoreductase, partial [Streptomyces sp. SID7499]|nr:FAD-binding oxidoreductase [Streptomyces sp. SID7499]
IAALTAKHFAVVEASARLAVAVADAVGDRVGDAPLGAVTRLARKAVRPDLVPEWLPQIPGAAARRLPRTDRVGASAVYYPACVNRIFAGPDGRPGLSLAEAVVAV